MAAYDPENIFAKMIDGKVPCFKVFESRYTLAFLDAFPVTEGHTLVIPKVKGYTSFIDMPPAKASEFLRDLNKVANIVKEATGADAINIWGNNGEEAGQTVFHPHFHIVPRMKDDKLYSYPPSAKEMLTPEQAAPLLKKMEEKRSPAQPLRKAKFGTIAKLRPDSKGFNLSVKILETAKVVEGKQTFYECLCGDGTGTVLLSLREEQTTICAEGKTVDLRNAAVKMIKNHIRVAVDKWGKIEESAEPVAEVEKAVEKNVSTTEYELV